MKPRYKTALTPLARSAIYELLSAGFLYPAEGSAVYLRARARRLVSTAGRVGRTSVGRALERLTEALGGDADGQLTEEYTNVFGHTVSTDCPPYEAEYGQAHIFQKSHTIADLRGFYKAFGVAPNPEMKDRPDHVRNNRLYRS